MPEFSAGSVVLPQLPLSIDQLKERVAAFRAQNAARQEAIDQAFIDVTRSVTGVDLQEAVAAGRRSETLGGGAVGPESILVDQLITSPTASSADLPPGVDERGRARVINQNQQTAYTVNERGELVAVQMLPMWTADP